MKNTFLIQNTKDHFFLLLLSELWFWMSLCVLLPDWHEIEDIGHSRTVTKQITKAELEHYGCNQDTVPAHNINNQTPRSYHQKQIRPGFIVST